MKKINKANKAITLLAVLWSVLIISSIVSSVIFVIKQKMENSSEAINYLEAEMLAQRGISLAQHSKIKNNDPILHNKFENGEYVVKIFDEGGRIHLNALLLQGHSNILKELFILWGLELDQTNALVDSLKDWIDEDDFSHLNGAEKEDYENLGKQGLPFNKPFLDLNEVKLVMGFNNLTKVKPNWQDYFTLWSDGKINLLKSNSEIISAVTQVDIEKAEQFLKFIEGEDKIKETEDDNRDLSIGNILEILQVNQEVSSKISPILSTQTNISRVESIGIYFDYVVQKTMVFKQLGLNKQIYYYKKKNYKLK